MTDARLSSLARERDQSPEAMTRYLVEWLRSDPACAACAERPLAHASILVESEPQAQHGDEPFSSG